MRYNHAMPAPVIRALTPADTDAALDVINTAARWYREFLPSDEFHDPEMTREQFEAEARRMTWYGAFVEGALVGGMGLEEGRGAARLPPAHAPPPHPRGG